MAMQRIRVTLLFCSCLALGACGASNATTPAPSAAAAAPTAALNPTAVAQTQLDQPLLNAPTELPTGAPAPATALPAATTALEAPSPTPVHHVQRLVIKDIGLDQNTVSVGLDAHGVPIVPKHEVGWYNLSAAPGQGNNVVLWGHVLRFRDSPNIPAPFRRVRELKKGAQIVVYDDTNTPHTYAVADQVYVTPEQVKYILPTNSEQLTLVSCIGDKVKTEAGVEMTHRLITIAKPVT